MGRPVRDVELRAAGEPLPLWDVANTEAHVRAILETGLRGLRARLSPSQSSRAFQYLWSKCWELSGLESDGKTLRYVWIVRGFLAPRGPLEHYQLIKLPPFRSRDAAAVVLEALKKKRPVAFASIEQVRPTGAYDPSNEISFSTYSHRILTSRIIDWYRSDPEFGDTRYSSGQRTESLEELADRARREHDGGDDSFLDRHGPGSRLEFVDELNRHAYQESIEEVLTREAVGL